LDCSFRSRTVALQIEKLLGRNRLPRQTNDPRSKKIEPDKEPDPPLVEVTYRDIPMNSSSENVKLVEGTLTSMTPLDNLKHKQHLVKMNDPKVVELDLSYNPLLCKEKATELFESLKTNIHVKRLMLPGVFIDTQLGLELSDMLRQNCTLSVINLEHNQIGPEAILELARALESNKSLQNLHIGHQWSSPTRIDAEQAFLDSLRTNERYLTTNISITKLTYAFRSNLIRIQVDRLILRNCELARKARRDSKMD
jgi:hypothetical protein